MSDQQIDEIIRNIRTELKYWDKHLWSFLSGPDMKNIIRYLVGLKDNDQYFVPSLPIAFRPYKVCKPDKVRCIIITSLKCNTIESTEKYSYPMSPSNETIRKILNTVQKERSIATDKFLLPQASKWALEGVLQVSTAMTSILNGNHHYIVWRPWIEYLVNKINELYPDIPVIFIGKDANQYKTSVKSPHQYTVDTWPHVWHNDCWFRVNELLQSKGKKPIEWATQPNPNVMTRKEANIRKFDRINRAKVIREKREKGMSDEVRNRTKTK